MSRLHPGFPGAAGALSLQIPQDRDYARHAAPRRSSLMRKFDVAWLDPDLSVSLRTLVAPATPLFEEAACAFARGTLIPTLRGQVAVEDLMPGDYVDTTNGREAVLWVGSTTFVPGREDAGTMLSSLTRITADMDDYGLPGMDVLVGPAARRVIRHARLERLLGQDAVLAPVADYVDGDRLLSVTPAGPVQLYHFMLKRHATIRIGGFEMETYHPGKALSQMEATNMRQLFLSLFPHIDQPEDCGPVRFTRTTREVIDSLLDT